MVSRIVVNIVELMLLFTCSQLNFNEGKDVFWSVFSFAVLQTILVVIDLVLVTKTCPSNRLWVPETL